MRYASSIVAAFLSAAAVSTAFVPASYAPRFQSSVAFRPMAAGVAVASRTTPVALRSTTVAAEEAKKETYEFTSDVGRVMDLIINSLYSDKDIFLRELVSNAADACDKKRFLSITDDATASSPPPEIKIKCNPDDNTLIIEDGGVGMTKDELINNLGKIAQSGTKAFVQALGESKADVNLIGQFGVGFYSAYLVAEKVEVVTKSMQEGSKQYRWTSTADSSYTIEEDNEDPIVGSGTRLILHMKEEAADYLEYSKIDELLKRYSEFIEFPIKVWKQKTEYQTVPDEEANKDLKEGEKPKTKTVPTTTEAYELVNNQKPIWLRPIKDVTEQEYKDFYKSAFRNAYDDPMKWTHFALEGQVECKALLYIPGMLPFELSRDMFDQAARNIRLYVKRVFINDQFDDLMPRWLKFVRGVVDSDDLPLNVSREILQKSKVLSIINKRLVRKSLDMFRDLAEDEDKTKYIMFWNNFGKYLKVGAVEDDANRKDIAPLLRFFSSKSGEEFTSLDEYVKSMPEKQKAIYYVTGDGREGAAMSPVVEKLSSRGYNVLFAIEPLDEIMMESLRNFKDKPLVDAAKDSLKLDDEDKGEDDKKKLEKLKGEFKDVADYLETLLSDKVSKVVVTDLLTDSPAALVQGAYGMSPTMQRYMKAQAVASGSPAGAGAMNKAVLEVNPYHPIVKDLDRMVKDDKESKELADFALLMYDVAAMTSGYDLEDTKSFASRVMGLMDKKVGGAKEPSSSKRTKSSKGDDDDMKATPVEVIE